MKNKLKALIQCKKIDEDKAIIDGVFSSANEDRHGDIVMQNFDLKSFKKNPVILNSHDHMNADSVIGKAIKISIKDGKLSGKIQFAVDENPKAKVIFDLVKGGYLNAFSIGFMPKEFDDKGTILKSELLEISVVSVPANADCLINAKAKGIDTDLLYDNKDIKNKKDNGKTTKDEDNDSKSWRGKNKQGIRNVEGDEEIERTAFEEIKKEYNNWDETNEYIRYKARDIFEFVEGTLSKVIIKESMPKIEATVGKLPKGDKEYIQMLFFPKSEGWTNDDARKWFSQRQLQVIGTGNSDDSINIGKSARQSAYDIIKAENKAQLNRLNKICEAIKLVGEIKVETPLKKEDRADKGRIVNKCLRELLKIKKK